jgi:hypothetical protein
MAFPVASRTAAVVLREGTVAEASELIEKIAKERGFKVSGTREVTSEYARLQKIEEAKATIVRAREVGEVHRFNQSFRARQRAGDRLPHLDTLMKRLAERIADERDAPPFTEITLASLLSEIAGAAEPDGHPYKQPQDKRKT